MAQTDGMKQILADIEALRGRVVRDGKSPNAPVSEVNLHGTSATDALLGELEKLGDFEILNLFDTPVTNIGLSHLAKLRGLQRLNLNRTRITDDGLIHLKELNALRYLNLGRTQVTDAAVNDLQVALPNVIIDR